MKRNITHPCVQFTLVAILVLSLSPALAIDCAYHVDGIDQVAENDGFEQLRGVATHGATLFVAAGTSLEAHDITSIGNPVPLDVLTFDTPVWDVEVVWPYAYVVVDGDATGVHVVDIANAADLVAVGSSFASETVHADDMIVADGHVWATGFRGAAVFDVTDPADPSYRGHTGRMWVHGAAAAHGYVYLAVGSTEPPDPQKDFSVGVFEAAPDGPVAAELWHDDFGDCADAVADPIPYCIAARDNELFVGLEGAGNQVSELQCAILDISVPPAPVYLACIDDVDLQWKWIEVSGHYLYAYRQGFEDRRLSIFDVRDPFNWFVAAEENLAHGQRRLVVEDGEVLTIQGDGEAIEVYARQCDPPAIQAGSLVSSIRPTSPDGDVDWIMSWKTDHATNPRLDVVYVDEVDPACPAPVAVAAGFQAHVQESCVWEGDGYRHTLRFPAGECQPDCVYDWRARSHRQNVHTTSETRRHKVTRCPAIQLRKDGGAPSLAAAPNPFNPTTVLRCRIPADAVRVDLGIFDARGRRVRGFEIDAGAVGLVEIAWDGTDDRGQRQASGLYFAKLTVDGRQQVLKLGMLK